MEEARIETKKELARFYNDDARHYHEIHYIDRAEYTPLKQRQLYIEEMVGSLGLSPGARILDVGCGPGQLVLNLLRKGHQVRGVDISSGMVNEARALIRANGFPDFAGTSVGDIERLEFRDREFDVVIASGVIEYQDDDDVALREMKRVLKPRGHLILNVTNKFSYLTISDNLYDAFKNLPGVRSVLSVARKGVLGDSRMTEIPKHRTHSPRQFDRKLAEHGFKKVVHNYFRFNPLPTPLASFFPSSSLAIGQKMESLTRGPLGFFGGGYLVLARRED